MKMALLFAPRPRSLILTCRQLAGGAPWWAAPAHNPVPGYVHFAVSNSWVGAGWAVAACASGCDWLMGWGWGAAETGQGPELPRRRVGTRADTSTTGAVEPP
jgi:hypothetical protein